MYPHQKLDWSASRLEALLNDAPDDNEARLELGRIYLSRGLYHGGGESSCAQALAVARRLLQDNPDHTEALILGGTALVGMERPEQAMKYLEEALKKDAPVPDVGTPVDASAGKPLLPRPELHFGLGGMYRALKNLPLAVRHLDISARYAPRSWEVHLLLGRTLSELARKGGEGRLTERSQYHLVCALKLEPPIELLQPLMRDLGLSCLATGRFLEAEKLFVRLKENPRYAVSSRKYLGQVAFGLGKFKNAIQHFRHYLEEHGDDAWVYAQVGMAYLQLGELEKAREACERSLLLDPHLLAARHAYGCTYLAEKQPQEAIRIFKETLHDHPEDLLSYTELVKTHRMSGDHSWLSKALAAEVSNFDRLPMTAGDHAPRLMTRKRIAALVEELKKTGTGAVSAILGTLDLSDDEALRFSLWEAACMMVGDHVGAQVAVRMKEPGKNFSVGLARTAIAAHAHIPEAALTVGLSVTQEDVKRAAVERRGNAQDLSAHRRQVDQEHELARAYQAILLLAIASRRSRSAGTLLATWGKQADTELAVAIQAGQLLMGDGEATRLLAKKAQEKGLTGQLEKLLGQLVPASSVRPPRTVGLGEQGERGDGELHCTICGRTTGNGCSHLMAGNRGVICSVCVGEILEKRSGLRAPDGASCDLCGRTHFETRGLYRYGGGSKQKQLEVCKECLELSSGLRERDEVDRFLSTW